MESENIKIFLRIKPEKNKPELNLTNKTMDLNGTSYAFDQVFLSSSQQEIYGYIANSFIVQSMQGYDSIIFAYGQTGSGKTYTIQGSIFDRGLIPRTLGFIYNKKIEDTRSKINPSIGEEELKVSFTFVEIYNEQLFDLFNPENVVSLREDPFKGVFVENLTEISASNYEESMISFNEAIKNRRTGSTQMNRESSRSHSIFTIHLKMEKHGVKKQSKIIFVDLAGSERLKEFDSVRKAETSNINKSLLCLGEVIKKLSNGDSHISYRDSKLTFLLRESLCGNSKLAVIGTINPSSDHLTETLNTLKFLKRVKMMKTNPILHTEMENDIEGLKNRIKELDAENQRLKMDLYLSKQTVEEGIDESSGLIYKILLNRIVNINNKVLETFEELKKEIDRFESERYTDHREKLKDIAKKQEMIIEMERLTLTQLSIADNE